MDLVYFDSQFTPDEIHGFSGDIIEIKALQNHYFPDLVEIVKTQLSDPEWREMVRNSVSRRIVPVIDYDNTLCYGLFVAVKLFGGAAVRRYLETDQRAFTATMTTMGIAICDTVYDTLYSKITWASLAMRVFVMHHMALTLEIPPEDLSTAQSLTLLETLIQTEIDDPRIARIIHRHARRYLFIETADAGQPERPN